MSFASSNQLFNPNSYMRYKNYFLEIFKTIEFYNFSKTYAKAITIFLPKAVTEKAKIHELHGGFFLM